MLFCLSLFTMMVLICEVWSSPEPLVTEVEALLLSFKEPNSDEIWQFFTHRVGAKTWELTQRTRLRMEKPCNLVVIEFHFISFHSHLSRAFDVELLQYYMLQLQWFYPVIRCFQKVFHAQSPKEQFWGVQSWPSKMQLLRSEPSLWSLPGVGIRKGMRDDEGVHFIPFRSISGKRMTLRSFGPVCELENGPVESSWVFPLNMVFFHRFF